MENNKKLTLTVPEAARILGISRNLAYELAKQDRLPVKVLRLGDKRMVVSRQALEDLLSGRQCEKAELSEQSNSGSG